MYLNKKTYVKNWDHMKPEELHNIVIQKGGKIREDIKSERISYIQEEVCYWRKANQIHNWFIENCADGDHDRREMDVTKDQLKELLTLCQQVIKGTKLIKGQVVNGQKGTKNGWENIYEDGKIIKNSELAEELLPTVDGFFFGSTEYDEYYINDLKHTIKVLKKELENSNADYYTYEASW